MPRQAREIPDISEELARYKELNPAYQLRQAPWPNNPHAVKDLERLAVDDKGEALDQNEAARRVSMFQIAIHCKIDQLVGNQLWPQHRAESDEVFESSERTFLKTVQELLTHPTERMVFAKKWLKKDGNFDLALQSIVIDPRLINNKLLENLGLTEFIPEPGTKQEDQLAKRAQAIPQIREMLKNLEPVLRQGEGESDANYFRLMRIKSGGHAGQLIGTQEIEGRKRLFRCRDLQDAYRRLKHIETGYEAEIAKLTEIMTTLKEVRDRLDDWDEIKFTKEIEAIKTRLAELVDGLKFARDKSKTKLKERIEHMFTLKDRSGPYTDKRYNPSKIQATIVGAIGKGTLGQRFRRITGISEKVAEDRVRLGELIQGQRAPMHRFAVTVEKLHQDLLILNPDQPLEPKDKARIITNLQKVRRLASELKFEPYLTFGQKFVEQIDETLAALSSDDRPQAAKEFVKLYLIAKLERAYTQIKQVERKISLEAEAINPTALKSELQNLHVQMEKHQVASGIKVSADNPDDQTYYNAYIAIYYLFNSLKARLIEIEVAQGRNKNEKLALMKQRIEGFDFAKLVKTLDHPEIANPYLPTHPRP